MAEGVERIDNPIERLELLAGDDEAISSFLDQTAVTGPRDREMLGELARTRALADPERLPVAHRRAVASLETLTGLVTALVVVGGSWVILRGAAMASRRIRLCTRATLEDLWQTVGYCGRPPRDHSRRFAIIAITLTVGAWVILPIAVALAFTS